MVRFSDIIAVYGSMKKDVQERNHINVKSVDLECLVNGITSDTWPHMKSLEISFVVDVANRLYANKT